MHVGACVCAGHFSIQRDFGYMFLIEKFFFRQRRQRGLPTNARSLFNYSHINTHPNTIPFLSVHSFNGYFMLHFNENGKNVSQFNFLMAFMVRICHPQREESWLSSSSFNQSVTLFGRRFFLRIEQKKRNESEKTKQEEWDWLKTVWAH